MEDLCTLLISDTKTSKAFTQIQQFAENLTSTESSSLIISFE